MLPELIQIGSFPIRSFGLMLALTFLLGVWYIRRMTTRDRLPFDPFLTLAYVMIFGGVIGARLSFALLHWSDYADNLGGIFNPFSAGQFGLSGLNLYGGVLLAIIGSVLFCLWKKLPILETFDYFAGPLALGIGISRIGCFLNGCCFGTPTDLPWGVHFPDGSLPWSIFGPEHLLHPAQLYSSLYGFALFALLHHIGKNKRFSGQLLALVFIFEAIFRFAIEYVRYYEDAMYFTMGSYQPTYNQVVSVSLLIAGILIYFYRQRRGIRDQVSA